MVFLAGEELGASFVEDEQSDFVEVCHSAFTVPHGDHALLTVGGPNCTVQRLVCSGQNVTTMLREVPTWM